MITNTTTIRLEIEKGIRQKGHSLSSFGKLAGINRGIISGILNGNPPKSISIRQLDLMAEALGHEEGWMYEYYVDECFINEKADWRRIKAFLMRCTEIGRYDCIQAVLDRLMEDLSNTVSVFGLAEELYEDGKVKESIPFYECVIENEKHQHSERLAIAHYRVFRASIGENTEQNFRAAVRFEPFRDRLPEHFMLDGLLALANLYYVLENWYYLERYGDELNIISQAIYTERQKKFKETGFYEPLQAERRLVVYYGQSYVIKSIALEYLGRYEEAKDYVTKYADLSWFEELDEVGLKEVAKFKSFATANMNNLNLLLGDTSKLDAYVSFLLDNPNEILPSLCVILQAANENNFSIDNILDKLYSKISLDQDYYEVTASLNRYIDLYYQLAIYHYKKSSYGEAIDNTIESLRLSIKISNKSKILDRILIFEQLRKFATDEHLNHYNTIIEEATANEKSLFFFNSST
ncbi:DNA-binding protein [Paenibacillus kandeliae]|uniref:DNA-binding protein n=1 Tax=Paenibacillus kandeliae TaxID=3231269 RepID=UPI003459DB17